MISRPLSVCCISNMFLVKKLSGIFPKAERTCAFWYYFRAGGDERHVYLYMEETTWPVPGGHLIRHYCAVRLKEAKKSKAAIGSDVRWWTQSSSAVKWFFLIGAYLIWCSVMRKWCWAGCLIWRRSKLEIEENGDGTKFRSWYFPEEHATGEIPEGSLSCGGDGGEVDIYIFIICHFICESRLWYALVTQVRYEGIAELYLWLQKLVPDLCSYCETMWVIFIWAVKTQV